MGRKDHHCVLHHSKLSDLIFARHAEHLTTVKEVLRLFTSWFQPVNRGRFFISHKIVLLICARSNRHDLIDPELKVDSVRYFALLSTLNRLVNAKSELSQLTAIIVGKDKHLGFNIALLSVLCHIN